MLELDKELGRRFQGLLEDRSIPERNQGFYWKWLRFFFDFCGKYGFADSDPEGLEAFTRKLAEKGQETFKQKQAIDAVRIYWRLRERSQEKTPPEGGELDDGWEDAIAALGESIKTRQYSRNTLRTYVGWVRDFRNFASGLHLKTVDAADAARFFTFLAAERRVAASTQNQAFNALLFFFKHVLKKPFEGFEGVVRAKRSNYIPVVLSREEVDRVISRLKHPFNLMASVLYGCGLRRFEVVNLRVHSLNFDAGILTVLCFPSIGFTACLPLSNSDTVATKRRKTWAAIAL